VQNIEATTTRISEIEVLLESRLAATKGCRSARRSLLTTDRDQPDTHV
jgi:hypothetical protein